jgi:hypothetical protein
MVGTTVTEAIAVKALALGVSALAGEEHLWLASICCCMI